MTSAERIAEIRSRPGEGDLHDYAAHRADVEALLAVAEAAVAIVEAAGNHYDDLTAVWLARRVETLRAALEAL